MVHEIADTELEAFQKKATRYLAALGLAPLSRSLELIPAIAILSKLNERFHDGIADVMSGSGYLARHLGGVFSQVFAIEACREMTRLNFPSTVTLRLTHSAETMPAEICSSNCKVAAALASFHHLLRSDRDGRVNFARSVERQLQFMRSCFDEAPNLDAFLLIDVPEARLEFPHGSLPWGSGSLNRDNELFKFAESITGHANFLGSLSDYSSLLGSLTEDLPGNAAKWFRSYVHQHSVTGHLDCFVSQQLVTSLSQHFRVSGITLPTPWLFASKAQFQSFLWDKFALKEDDPRTTMESATEAAHELLGLHELHSGGLMMGWQLSYILCERK